MNIKELRKNYGFTQKQLADVIGIQQTALSRYESGKRKIPTYIMKSILNAFQVLNQIAGNEQPDIIDENLESHLLREKDMKIQLLEAENAELRKTLKKISDDLSVFKMRSEINIDD